MPRKDEKPAGNNAVDEPSSGQRAVTPSASKDLEEGIARNIDDIARKLLEEAEAIRARVDSSIVQNSLNELRSSIELLRAITRDATARISPEAQWTRQTVASIGRPDLPGCTDDHRPQCCIKLFMSKVRVLEGQNLGDKNQLELIFAVHAGCRAGILPGLTGHIGLNAKNKRWTPVCVPIGKFCVPCHGCLTVPLVAEAFETGGLFEGLPEFGSTSTAITLKCDCDIIPVPIVISLSGGGVGRGLVEVQVDAVKVAGGCC